MDRAYGKTLHSRGEAACPRDGPAGLEAVEKALANSFRSQHGGLGAPGRDWAMPGPDNHHPLLTAPDIHGEGSGSPGDRASVSRRSG